MPVALGWAVFIAGCAYVGFVGEMLKDALPATHRVVLSIGFILGVGALSRWMMELDIGRSINKIRGARRRRRNVS